MKVGDKISKLNIIHALISGAAVMVLFIIFAVACQIAPFGDKTYLMYDMKRQYVDYYAYYKSILSGENNLFYSFSTTLGAGTVGFYAYYLTSPFLWALALVPNIYLPIGITVIIGLKLATAAVLMDLFFQYYIQIERTEFDAISLGAVSWAFSGYLIAHSMNMMWIDVIILLPVIIVSIDCILLDNRKLPYIITLGLMLLLNYYITYQVIIFIAIWAMVRMHVLEEKHMLKKIGDLLVSTILGAGVTSFIMLPTAFELINSPKDIINLGLKLEGMRLNVVDIMSKAPALAYDYIEPRYGYPQIYCGVLLFILCIIYFFDKQSKQRERVGTLILMAIFLVSFCLDAVNLFWHAGMEPSGHPYREAFLMTFLVIVCATIELNRLSSIERRNLFVGCGLAIVGFINVLRPRYDHVNKIMIMVNVVLLGIYIILLLVSVVVGKEKIGIRRFAMTLLMVVQVTELLMNACYTYMWQSQLSTKQSEYKETVSKVYDAKNELQDIDDGFYRMENLTPRQQNDAMQYAYNGVTHYSSAGMMYVRSFLQQLGYNDTGLYVDYSHHNTVAADSLLGVKYVLSDGSILANNSYELISDDEEKIYRNPYALGVAVSTVGYDINRAVIRDNNPFKLQEQMYSDMLGECVHIFDEAKVSYADSYDLDGAIIRSYDIEITGDGYLYMYLGDLLGKTQDLTVYLEGEVYSTYGNAACVRVLNLGYYDGGETVKVTINGGGIEADFGNAYFVTENIDNLESITNMLNRQIASIERKSSSHLLVKTEGDGVFMSIPYEKGWIITVDGKRVEPTEIYGALTYVDLGSVGEHTVEMRFVPPGIITGTVVAVLALLLILVIAKQEKK